LIALDYDEQLAIKRERLTQAVRPYSLLAGVEIRATVGAEEISGYRVRAKLIVAAGAKIGLFARGSHDVIDIPDCRTLTPALARVAAAIRELVEEPPSAASRPLTPSAAAGGALRALDLREARDGAGARVLATLVLDSEASATDPDVVAAASALMSAAPEIAGVAVSARESGAARVLGATPRVVAGANELTDTVGGVPHFATHGAFVQAHRGQAAALHEEIERQLESKLGALDGRRIYDLFGGSGAIGLKLARAGAKVTLIETFEPAVDAARRAGAGRLEARVGDASALSADDRPDAVVVNPPRRGLRGDIREAVARLAPSVVVYVSCSPDTLARDLSDLARRGYAARQLIPFDMIPLSEQVETLAILEPVEPPAPETLLEHGDLLVVDKLPFEPMTPQGNERSLLERVQRRPGWDRAVALSSMEREVSGVALFVRTAAAASDWRLAWADAQASAEHLVLVRGAIKPRGVVRRPLMDGGKSRPAVTRYERVDRVAGHSLVRATAAGPRKRQISRHLAGIGHPVVGDARHGHSPTNRHFVEKMGLDRSFHHLCRVELADPTNGRRILLESPLAADLATVLVRLTDSTSTPDPA